jgi:curli biogenesis system outer membrane secretion channel CsgG
MRNYIKILFVFFLACGTTMESMQKEYSDSAFSPNFDQYRSYRLAVLPVSSSGIKIAESEINSLYDFISLELLKTGHFSLIERKAIEDLLKEQEFGVSGVVDASTAAKIGKILGADAVMLTEISELKRDEFFQDENAYDSKIFVRIINVSTAEILFYGKGRGESMQGKISALEMAISNATKALQGGMK